MSSTLSAAESFTFRLNFINRYLSKLGPLPRQYLCGIQDLMFKEIRISRERGESRALLTALRSCIWGALHLFLGIVSLVTIIKARIVGIKLCHYMIDTQNGIDGYDHRSGYALEVVPAQKSINLFHITSAKSALRGVFTHSNPVYFESLARLWSWLPPYSTEGIPQFTRSDLQQEEFDIFNSFSNRHALHFSKVAPRLRALHRMLSFLGIKKVLLIDDGRHANEIVLICNRLTIPTVGYMHNRFNEFHIGLKYFPFDSYLVWSQYYRNKIVSMLAEVGITNSEIHIIGHPRLNKLTALPRPKSLRALWLGEANVDQSKVFKIVSRLVEQTDIEVVFRPKSKDDDFHFLEGTKVIIDYSPSFFDALHEHQISVVLGTHSTALIDCWLAEVPSIMLESPYDYGEHLIKDSLVIGLANGENIVEMVRKAGEYTKSELESIKKRIWGETSALNSEVLEYELCQGI